MRRDSEICLKKILNYRNNIGKNSFELNYKYFDDIPCIETAMIDILDDLIKNDCLTSKSQIIDLEGNISINLTLNGITYFDDEKEKNSAVIFNISGGQVNIAKENAKIDAIMNNIEPAKDQRYVSGQCKKDRSSKIDLRNVMDIDKFNSPTPFFDYRFGKAFPGVRGVKEFDNPEECIDRLEILLRNPLNRNKKNMTDPIWWLRGSIHNEISSFERLDRERFLMDEKQLKVKKIVVYSSFSYYKKFVYVETSPEKATGLYGEITQEQIDYWVEQIGSYYEEYAIFDDHLITRAEYDDGAAVIGGKVIDIENQARIRTRYLTPYNFIICAKWNPLNESKYDSDVQKILYGIFKGTHTIYDLVNYTGKLSRHKMDL